MAGDAPGMVYRVTDHSPNEQRPFAVILGCSDSRVPAELVFDQGFGDLFVVRVAGNIATPSQIGSVEFAAAKLGTRLVVVLGHTRCGAVLATLEAVANRGAAASPNLRPIIDAIGPSVEGCTDDSEDLDTRVARAVRANVRSSVRTLRDRSELLADLARTGGLRVVGAEYCLDSGAVTFLDEA